MSSAPLHGRLRLGVIPTVAPYLLPRVLPGVRRRYPALRLTLHEGRTEEIAGLLQRGELDLILVALEADLGPAVTHPLFEDPFAVALRAGHRLARRKTIREEELQEESVLLLVDGHCLRDQVLRVCESAGAAEAGDFRASSLTTLVQMVAGGAGITLVPSLASAIEGSTRDLVLVPFRRPAPFRTIGLAWRAASPRAAEFRELGGLLVPSGRGSARR